MLPAVLAAKLTHFLRDFRAIAAVEMALVSPFLLLLFLGGTETARFITTHYQAAQMASTVADAIARYERLTGADAVGVFEASSSVMGRSDFNQEGYVILTSVTTAAAADRPKVAWQCGGGGMKVHESLIGELGKDAALPGGLVIDANDNVVIAEVFYEYRPLFDVLPIEERDIYKFAVFRPRLGALTSAAGC